MKISLKDIADSLGVPFELVKWNPLIFGEAVKRSNVPNDVKVGLLNNLAQMTLIDRSWNGLPET
jgi:hypothetical protein